jgi:hypothetical protein
MVTDRQVRRLRMELGKGESLLSAALRSGMSENTARRHRTGELPGQRKSPRKYRTRPDPFAEVWPEIEAMLEQAPGLEAVTIFEALRGREELIFSDGQLRTLQRRIRRWRASQGPEREVFFAQQHRIGARVLAAGERPEEPGGLREIVGEVSDMHGGPGNIRGGRLAGPGGLSEIPGEAFSGLVGSTEVPGEPLAGAGGLFVGAGG